MPMMNMIQSDSSLGKMEQSYLNELNKALYQVQNTEESPGKSQSPPQIQEKPI